MHVKLSLKKIIKGITEHRSTLATVHRSMWLALHGQCSQMALFECQHLPYTHMYTCTYTCAYVHRTSGNQYSPLAF